MSKRKADAVILCEDKQHESYFKRLLKQTKRFDYVRISPYPKKGMGSGEAYVRAEFPSEVRDQRRRPSVRLLVAMDADNRTVEQSYRELLDQLDKQRSKDERIAVFIPKWEIETWIEYLLHGGPVDEERSDYPKLRGRESECHPAADRLFEIVRGFAQDGLPDDCPPSLRRAITDECPRLR